MTGSASTDSASTGNASTGGASTTNAVSWLFVPGDRPERFPKAAAAGAHAVVLDLEDAVTPERKDLARREVASWLDGGGVGWVRVNATGTPWYAADLAAVCPTAGLVGLVLPKAEDPAALASLRRELPHGSGILALVETALGVHRAVEVAGGGADRLAFGSVDYALDVGADGSWESLLHARCMLVLASRVSGLPPPVDGVTTALRDPERLGADVAAARRIGFTGKLCIHPDQVPLVNDGFAPSSDELAWARRVLAATATGAAGAVAVDGAMVDRPVLARARGILDRAGVADPT